MWPVVATVWGAMSSFAVGGGGRVRLGVAWIYRLFRQEVCLSTKAQTPKGFVWTGDHASAIDVATMDAALQSISYDEAL